MMGGERPTYEALKERLAEAEKFIQAIRSGQADAVIANESIYLIRFKEMEEQLRCAIRMSKALNRINETVHSTLDLDEILRNVLSEAAAMLGSESAALSLRQDHGWIVRHVHGMPANLVALRMTDEQERHAVHAIRTRRPVTVSDAFNDDRSSRAHFRRYKIRAVLVSPLMIRDESLGVIFFNYHTAPHAFTEMEVDFARQLGATVSIALENARLFDQVTKSHKTLQKARDELELRVRQRTVQLETSNEELELEVEKRRRVQAGLKVQGKKLLAAYRRQDYLSRQLVDLLERERREIGNALHEDIGQIMTGVLLQLEKLKTPRPDDRGGLVERVVGIQEMIRGAVRQSRKISQNLRLEGLERFGLVAAIDELVRGIQKESDVRVHFLAKNIPEDLRQNGKGLAIYRVVQESLTNALRHAKTEEVSVNLMKKDTRLLLTVEDNGVGFDYDSIAKDEGPLGLTIMKERISQVGGKFRVESSPGKGARIVVEIPIAA
jgi:signal transduction histidine kinase